MNRKTSDARLLKLAEFLVDLPEKRFDYARFVGGDWGGAQDLSCGTTGCALGWAAALPTFRRLGLRLAVDWRSELGQVFGRITNIHIAGEHNSWQAAAEVFGVSAEEAEYLFCPDKRLLEEDGYTYVKGLRRAPGRTARTGTVARHILDFIAWRREQAKVAA